MAYEMKEKGNYKTYRSSHRLYREIDESAILFFFRSKKLISPFALFVSKGGGGCCFISGEPVFARLKICLPIAILFWVFFINQHIYLRR